MAKREPKRIAASWIYQDLKAEASVRVVPQILKGFT